MHLVKVFAVALSLGLDVFAVGVGVGMRGAPLGLKVRIGIAFAASEVLMNLAGLGLGDLAGRLLGSVAAYLGFGALVAVGLYMTLQSLRESEHGAPLDMSRGWGLLIASLSVSLDSLGIGFSILYIGAPLVLALGIIFGVSILCTAIGLSLGRFLGRRIEEGAELWAGIILMLTGAAFILARVFHAG